MAKSVILAQPSSTGRTKFVRVTLSGDNVEREWGLVGGSTQTTDNFYDGKFIGKSNEKSPEQVAEEAFNRVIKQKKKKGYKEVDSMADAVAVELDEMDLDNPPTSFTIAKPINTDLREEQPAMNLLFMKNRAIVQEKENGLGHFLMIESDGTARIYTRKFADHSRKYKFLLDELAGRMLYDAEIMPNSMFAIELIVPKLGNTGMSHMDRFKAMQSIQKADTFEGELKPDQTESHQRIAKYGVHAVVFNPIYLDGVDITKTKAYRSKILTLEQLFVWKDAVFGSWKVPQEIEVESLAELKQYLVEHSEDLEGAVVWDADGFTHTTMNGTPKRMGAWKAKLHDPADVIAYEMEEGTGNRQGKVGALKIGLYNKVGEMVDLGSVGSGLDGETIEPSYWSNRLPCVICIEFNARFETGKFQFPRYVGLHPDKTPNECVLEPKYDI